MKRFAGMILLTALLLSILPGTASALPPDPAWQQAYNYTPLGETVSCPLPYEAAKELTAADFDGAGVFAVQDVFATGTHLYLVDTAGNTLYVLDSSYETVAAVSTLTGELQGPATFSGPEGVFVDKDDNIFVADTQNHRVVKMDRTGRVLHEYTAPELTVGGEKREFLPSKLAVADSGYLYVVAQNINRGLVELKADGNFSSFVGAPKITSTAAQTFWRMFMTEEQRARSIKFVPTEYNNIFMDKDGFFYVTIGTVDADDIQMHLRMGTDGGNSVPIRKLNPSGTDVLKRQGFFPQFGDLIGTDDKPSTFVDVALHEGGFYAVLDARRNRIFTYSADGELLYVFGNKGNQFGMLQIPSSITYFGDRLVVSDHGAGKVVIYEPTDYGACVNTAARLHSQGRFEESSDMWREALVYNSNQYTAYVGLAKSEYNRGAYEAAMKYSTLVGEKNYYSKAFAKRRSQAAEAGAGIVAGVIAVGIAGGVVLSVLRKKGVIKRKPR